jgi:hypothetical protein
MRDNKARNILMIEDMFPSYIVLIASGVVLALVCSRLPEPAWNRVAMFGLAIAVVLIVIGFGIYRDS